MISAQTRSAFVARESCDALFESMIGKGEGQMKTRLSTRRRHVDRRAEAGFTLVEMLVVIAIIGLIMGLVGPRVLSSLGESKVKAAKLQIESFSSSLDLFYLDVGRYPTDVEIKQVE